mmetsp:Transcript_17125/g.23967  ORF Transcript_17125/g.23967 Transcript_17125/m.23967 type:complete len:120 (+) Transcript_17125:161-520(+)
MRRDTSRQRLVKVTSEYTLRPRRWFFLLEIEGFELTKISIAGMVQQAIQTLTGKVGCGIHSAEVIKICNPNTAIISLPSDSLIPLWGSLTLMRTFRDCQCRILIMKASPFLMAICDSLS